MLDLSLRFVPADNVIGTKVEDEILLQFEKQNYFGLRGAAVRIWKLTQHGTTGADTLQKLLDAGLIEILKLIFGFIRFDCSGDVPT